MDAADVTEVCRLCPSTGGDRDLLNVFDKSISFKYNIREVVLMYAGIEILENDIVSKKICQRCCNILYKMYEFRLDALKQDRKLKDKCGHYLEDRGIRLPNTCITIKKEPVNSSLLNKKIKTDPDRVQPSTSLTPSTSKEDLKKRLHPSVADVFRTYPDFKLPKKCFERHIAPVVSLTMGEVESYFRKRKLEMRRFIYKPRTRTIAPSAVVEKKTPVSTKPKTVAPLKISRKLLSNREEAGRSVDNSYICMSVPTEEKGRKRKISSGSDKSVDSKLSRNMQPKLLSTPKLNAEISKLTFDKLKASTTPSTMVTNSLNFKSVASRPIKTSSPSPSDALCRNSRTPSPAPADPISEDSRDSCSTNISEATSLSSSSKPQFMDSFGLIPTVTATKSHTLLVCNLCGSVHHNAYELKKHTNKHMVCQFCKRKFKSIESKQKHVDRLCPIKKVMNSSGPTIKLEKIDLNLDVRMKYRNVFTGFELIPGLEPTPVEQVILKAASPPPNNEDAVIVLSDDEGDSSARSLDPLSGIPTPSANMPPPAVENIVYSTVSIVRPDIRIKNNTILNSLVENMTDKQILKELLDLFRPLKQTAVETMSQTDLPAGRDVQINHVEGTCEFKNLKGHLGIYKIPIAVSNGPFNVSYQFKNSSNTNKQMVVWDDLPVIDICNKKSLKLPSENSSTLKNSSLSKNPSKSSLVGTSQPQSSDVTVSSVPVMTHNTTNSAVILPRTPITTVSTVTSNCSGLIVVQTASLNRPLEMGNLAIPINNTNMVSINASNSATPLLQNYALSITSPSIISNPIPIPRSYINSALSKTTSTSNRTTPSVTGNNLISKPYLSSVTTTYNRPLPTSSLATVSGPDSILVINNSSKQQTLSFSTVSKQPSSNLSLPRNNLLPKTTITDAAQLTNPLTTTSEISSGSGPTVPEISKFRVKSVWELQ